MRVSDITDEMIVRAAKAFHEDHHPMNTLEILCGNGVPMKVAFRALERAHRRGLIAYGVSLGTAWPTDAGKALLREASHSAFIPAWRELDHGRAGHTVSIETGDRRWISLGEVARAAFG